MFYYISSQISACPGAIEVVTMGCQMNQADSERMEGIGWRHIDIMCKCKS